jgi:hypothetical protein
MIPVKSVKFTVRFFNPDTAQTVLEVPATISNAEDEPKASAMFVAASTRDSLAQLHVNVYDQTGTLVGTFEPEEMDEWWA